MCKTYGEGKNKKKFTGLNYKKTWRFCNVDDFLKEIIRCQYFEFGTKHYFLLSWQPRHPSGNVYIYCTIIWFISLYLHLQLSYFSNFSSGFVGNDQRSPKTSNWSNNHGRHSHFNTKKNKNGLPGCVSSSLFWIKSSQQWLDQCSSYSVMNAVVLSSKINISTTYTNVFVQQVYLKN